MRTSSEQLRHTNATYGGASQHGDTSLSQKTARPDSGPDNHQRLYQLMSNIVPFLDQAQKAMEQQEPPFNAGVHTESSARTSKYEYAKHFRVKCPGVFGVV
eukprot:6212739-Pleurochrysis_carterae.AAC.5